MSEIDREKLKKILFTLYIGRNTAVSKLNRSYFNESIAYIEEALFEDAHRIIEEHKKE